jgi:pimeloyl-ACP methyl ester carboxylesterase
VAATASGRTRRHAAVIGLIATAVTLAPPAQRLGAAEPVGGAGRLIERDCDTAPSLVPTHCYWLEVPERRDVADPSTIRLWVAVTGTADPELPPVVDIAGGPGQTASTSWVSGEFDVPLVRGRMTVTMDARGVGRSEPRLSCPESDDDDLPPTEAWPLRVDQERRRQIECRDALVAVGVDLDGYDTVETAADYVDLRNALGVEQWVLRAGSYGGRLAREVYRQDPGGVAAMALFSPLTTAPAGPASLVERAEHAVARITAACAEQPACAANGDFAANLDAASAGLDSTPFELPEGGVIDGGVLRRGLIDALYDPALIPLVPTVGAQLAAGDTSILPAMADAIAGPPPPDERDELSEVVYHVVNCADEGAALTDADRQVLADPGVWEELIGSGSWQCDVWDVEPVAGGRLQPVSGDIPVLVVSGGLDPVTPPEFADEVVAGFPRAISLVVPAGGHSVGYLDGCTQLLSMAFILDPQAPLGTSCVDDLPPPFADG